MPHFASDLLTVACAVLGLASPLLAAQPPCALPSAARSEESDKTAADKQPAETSDEKPQAVSDERVLEAWSYLRPEERQEVVLWFASEVPWIGTFQTKLIDYALGLEESDPGFLPDAGETPFFDPQDHAPGQPIARKRLAPDAPRAVKVRETMFELTPEPLFDSAWHYDWAQREVVRSGDPEDTQRLFENALAGFAPKIDLARALITKQLDRGEEQLVLAAFSHAYTDRTGKVFPGVTLYDAWGSGTEFEMPDVDNLGIVHSVLGMRRKWVAPVPPTQHDDLYGRIGELYVRAKRYRGLRDALAKCYFEGTTELGGGYDFHLWRLHGLWEEHSSDATELALVLPDAKQWEAFLEEWALRFEKDSERIAAAQNRALQLDFDRERIRDLLVSTLRQYGAFERKSLPKPLPKPDGKRAKSGRGREGQRGGR